MIVWYIIIGIISFFLILMSMPFYVNIEYNSEIYVTLHYLFFKYSIFPPPVKSKKKKIPPKDEKIKKDEKRKANEKTAEEMMSEIISLVKSIAGLLKEILNNLTATKFQLFIKITGDDAADTGIKFGKINIAVHTVLALARNIVNIKKPHIVISPDFLGDKDSLYMHCVLRVFPIVILGVLIKFSCSYLYKNIIQGGAKNESTSSK